MNDNIEKHDSVLVNYSFLNILSSIYSLTFSYRYTMYLGHICPHCLLPVPVDLCQHGPFQRSPTTVTGFFLVQSH
jgi:nitrate reductase beta subunit